MSNVTHGDQSFLVPRVGGVQDVEADLAQLAMAAGGHLVVRLCRPGREAEEPMVANAKEGDWRPRVDCPVKSRPGQHWTLGRLLGMTVRSGGLVVVQAWVAEKIEADSNSLLLRESFMAWVAKRPAMEPFRLRDFSNDSKALARIEPIAWNLVAQGRLRSEIVRAAGVRRRVFQRPPEQAVRVERVKA